MPKGTNPGQGIVLLGLWLTSAEKDSMTWSLNNALRLTKKWEKLRDKYLDGEEVWLNDNEEATLENAENNISEILIEAFKRGDFIKR
jgi:hypothetical protein